MKNTNKPMEKMEQPKEGHAGMIIGVGIAAAAAIAGAYLLHGKDAKKHRAKVKSWALMAKGEILEKLENVSEMNEGIYHKIVQEVTDRYQGLKQIDPSEMAEFKNELGTHWKYIKKGLEQAIKGKTKKSATKKPAAKKKRGKK